MYNIVGYIDGFKIGLFVLTAASWNLAITVFFVSVLLPLYNNNNNNNNNNWLHTWFPVWAYILGGQLPRQIIVTFCPESDYCAIIRKLQTTYCKLQSYFNGPLVINMTPTKYGFFWFYSFCQHFHIVLCHIVWRARCEDMRSSVESKNGVR